MFKIGCWLVIIEWWSVYDHSYWKGKFLLNLPGLAAIVRFNTPAKPMSVRSYAQIVAGFLCLLSAESPKE